MVGAICKRDVLAHPWITIHCFGWRVFWRTLMAGRQRTFLSLVTESAALSQPGEKGPEIVDGCIGLELRAKRVYELLARRFSGQDPLWRVFETLARQEQEHAELLELCRQAAAADRWEEELLTGLSAALPGLKKRMEEAESAALAADSPAAALRLTLEIESSEVNRLFQQVVAAADSEFVRRVDAFRRAVGDHIAYVCRQTVDLEPSLAGQCRALESGWVAGQVAG